MNRMYTIIITALILCNIIQSNFSHFSPENTFFAFDIDDVLVETLNTCHVRDIALVTGGAWLYPSNTHNWIMSLKNIQKSYKRDEDGKKEKLFDEDGNPINGLAFHFLYHGMRDTNLASYVPFIVSTLEYYRTPINGTVELCQYLKEKGYIVVFATNKDRLSYDEFAQHIGTQVTDLPDKVFVAHSCHENFQKKIEHFSAQPHTPENYKQYARMALSAEPTENIRHVPTVKPEPSYYEYVHKSVQEKHDKKHMIFIDDKKTNINGVAEYNEQLSDEKAIGFVFENPFQLIQELLKIGILSRTHDQEFLKRMKKYR